ncbi:MAG: hypothetical protein M3545_12285 [Acidobacteriota bacterium]|nr:hypothetical protein [Acidobacteriota bacterium]
MSERLLRQRILPGSGVGCPGLPGCWSQGATEVEALENIRGAIRGRRRTTEGKPSSGRTPPSTASPPTRLGC